LGEVVIVLIAQSGVDFVRNFFTKLKNCPSLASLKGKSRKIGGRIARDLTHKEAKNPPPKGWE
jgi:hypothetical protein